MRLPALETVPCEHEERTRRAHITQRIAGRFQRFECRSPPFKPRVQLFRGHAQASRVIRAAVVERFLCGCIRIGIPVSRKDVRPGVADDALDEGSAQVSQGTRAPGDSEISVDECAPMQKYVRYSHAGRQLYSEGASSGNVLAVARQVWSGVNVR